jgi:hypothetical protein
MSLLGFRNYTKPKTDSLHFVVTHLDVPYIGKRILLRGQGCLTLQDKIAFCLNKMQFRLP